MDMILEYDLLDHPHKHEPSSIGERWANIKLKLFRDDTHFKTIVDWQWDAVVFFSWLQQNIINILNEPLPIPVCQESIAKCLFDFYKNLDDEHLDDDLLDAVYSYRVRHGLRFGLRGTDIPNIYLGMQDRKHYVSFYDEIEEWNYEISLDIFLNQLNNAYFLIKT
ncbi:hypothetical protein DYU05_03370 [Mucilaginibacter terrenus]|uniref:Uncharacterized protein n=1 Tax=Mucilaginibacter terrenus TaxID=2482727 RepID=A0A3E2NUH4_9SPHI|nr:hypothetical protein [Mucilaginibacter terrenus]RFZ84664.1 hypothetical protein DYU05_03370 [Mucilaginibacter terrenus]